MFPSCSWKYANLYLFLNIGNKIELKLKNAFYRPENAFLIIQSHSPFMHIIIMSFLGGNLEINPRLSHGERISPKFPFTLHGQFLTNDSEILLTDTFRRKHRSLL